MTAILKHELRSYFHSLTAYVFGAFLLVFVGIGAVTYNIQAAVSNFEFVLSFGSMVFVVIVPILTMRVLAEERKQKTDQLIDHIDRQQTDDLQEQRLELLEQELLRISRLEKELGAEAKTPVASAADIDVMAAADSAGPVSEPDEIYSLEEIEELDDEIELDDLFRELAAMGEAEEEEPQQKLETLPQPAPQFTSPQPAPEPPQPAPVQPRPAPQFIPPQPAPEPPQPSLVQTRHHQGYNIGRSGKKYTAEELNMLIRE